MKSIKKVVALILVFSMIIGIGTSTSILSEAKGQIRLNKMTVKIKIGKTYKLKVKNTKAKVRWFSDNKKIATVTKKGVVKGKKDGTTIITAKIKKNGKSKEYWCMITVGNGDKTKNCGKNPSKDQTTQQPQATTTEVATTEYDATSTPIYINGKKVYLKEQVSQLISDFGKPDRIGITNTNIITYSYIGDYSNYMQLNILNEEIIEIYTDGKDVNCDELKILMNSNKGLVIKPEVRFLGGSNSFNNIIIRNFKETDLIVNKTNTVDEIDHAAGLSIFERVNSYRAKNSIPLLKWNDNIYKVAELHSKYMNDKNILTHYQTAEADGTFPYGGNEPFYRLYKAQINMHSMGENCMPPDTNSTMSGSECNLSITGWIESEGHREILMNKNYTDVGIGTYGRYTTMDLICAE